MKKIRVFMAKFIAMGVLGVSGIFGSGGAALAHPTSRQGGDLIANALAFADAYNVGDTEKMRQLADPAFQQVGGTGEALDLDGFANSTSTGVRVTLSNCQLTRPDVVSCDTVLSGGPIPPLAHPWTETSVLTFANGKVLRLDETLSDQTAQDLQAFIAASPPPGGMPTTGVADLSIPLLALLLGLSLVMNGVLVRRTTSRRPNTL